MEVAKVLEVNLMVNTKPHKPVQISNTIKHSNKSMGTNSYFVCKNETGFNVSRKIIHGIACKVSKSYY